VGSASPVASWVSIATPLNVAALGAGSNRPDEVPEVHCRNPGVWIPDLHFRFGNCQLEQYAGMMTIISPA
jgi:hypothetical protein